MEVAKKMRGTHHPRLRPQDRADPGLVALLLGLSGLFSSCANPAPAIDLSSFPKGPYVIVLGTAQDGGLPQIGCEEEACERARREPAAGRLVTSLLLADPRTGQRWLFDASPDLREQVERARGQPPNRPRAAGRPPLFEGLFLTHAHTGHYTGLTHFGREAYASRGLPVYGSRRMLAFLGANAPWSFMVETGALEPRRIEAGDAGAIDLGEGLRVRALRVPHRDELSDTLAFVIEGPRRSLLYLPDIDKWERWELPIEEVVAGVDVALLDGTFFADGEIPGRSMAEIPHPFVTESLARFGELPAAERAKIYFTHLNHTNPAALVGGAAERTVRAAGMHVLREGERFDL